MLFNTIPTGQHLIFNPIPTGQHFDIVQPDSYRSTIDIQLIPMTDIITHDDSYGNLVPIEQLYPQFFTFRVSPPLAHEEPASPFEKGCARNTWKVAYTSKMIVVSVEVK